MVLSGSSRNRCHHLQRDEAIQFEYQTALKTSPIPPRPMRHQNLEAWNLASRFRCWHRLVGSDPIILISVGFGGQLLQVSVYAAAPAISVFTAASLLGCSRQISRKPPRPLRALFVAIDELANEGIDRIRSRRCHTRRNPSQFEEPHTHTRPPWQGGPFTRHAPYSLGQELFGIRSPHREVPHSPATAHQVYDECVANACERCFRPCQLGCSIGERGFVVVAQICHAPGSGSSSKN